jgi:hypothetical protein
VHEGERGEGVWKVCGERARRGVRVPVHVYVLFGSRYLIAISRCKFARKHKKGTTTNTNTFNYC